MIVHWLIFLLCSAAIIVAGIKLAGYGDSISSATRLGHGCIGLLFLATVTSIPELTTTLTGSMLDVPNIAVGNALGSNLFNIVIIAVADILLLGAGPFLFKVRSYHVVSGGIVILLSSLTVLGIVIKPNPVMGISPISIMIFVIYVLGIFLLFRRESREEIVQEVQQAEGQQVGLGHAIAGFVVCAAVIIVAGIFLIYSSKAISLETGLSASLMGVILVAIVTSLPELATTVGALRIGAYDMILGNLFGSNMFNILTIFFADIAFRRGAILSRLGNGESDQLIVALLGIILAGVTVAAISYRSRRRIFGMGVDAAIILAVYVAGTIVIINRGIHL